MYHITKDNLFIPTAMKKIKFQNFTKINFTSRKCSILPAVNLRTNSLLGVNIFQMFTKFSMFYENRNMIGVEERDTGHFSMLSANSTCVFKPSHCVISS